MKTASEKHVASAGPTVRKNGVRGAALDPLLREVWEHSFDGMRIIDDLGNVLLVNEAYCRLAGMDRGRIIGKPFTEIYRAEGKAEAVEEYRQRFASQTITLHAEKEALMWDGRQLALEVSHSFLSLPGSTPLLLSIFRDVTLRKRAEEEFARQKAWVDQLFENMALGIAMLDAEGSVRAVNPAFEQLFGYSNAEVRGKNVDDFVVPPHLRDEGLGLSLGTANGTIADRETYRRRKDGSDVHVRVLGIPIRVDDRLVGIYGVYEDITRRKNAEDALRTSEERYRTLVEGMMDGVYRSAPDGRFLEVNPAMVRMFGFGSKEEMLGVKDTSALYADPVVRSADNTSADGSHIGVIHMRRKDGSDIWVEDHGNLVRGGDGTTLYHEGILRDITERKRIEDVLRQNEERFRSLVMNAQDVISIHDATGAFRYVTSSSLQAFGYAPHELIGRNPFDFIHPDDIGRALRDFESVQEHRQDGVPTEFRFLRRDGTYISLETVGRDLTEEPSIGGIVLTTRDVTERRRSEEALRESEARFRAVVEQSADGIFLMDVLTLQVVDTNAAFGRMLGYTREELLELTLFNVVSGDLSDVNRSASMVLNGGRPLTEERTYRTKDGSSVHVLASSSVIAYGGKRVVCIIVRDITERKKLEHDREILIKELQTALSNIRTLSGLIPICSSCKKIRDDRGYWNQLEQFLMEHSDATLSHGICPDCAKKLYPEVFDK